MAAKCPFQVSVDSGRAPSSGPAPRSVLNGDWGEEWLQDVRDAADDDGPPVDVA